MSDDDLTIPAFLRREDTAESQAARARLTKQLRRGVVRRVADSRSNVSTGYASLDETGKAILREAVKRGDMSDAMRDRAVRALRRKGSAMSQPGPKETALKDQRKEMADAIATFSGDVTKLPPGKANGVKTTATTSAPKVETTPTVKASQSTESAVQTKSATKAKPAKTASKPTTKATTSKKANANARTRVKPDLVADTVKEMSGPRWPKPGSKNAILLDHAVKHGKDGISWDALAKKVGWERCSYTLKFICRRVKAKLEERDGLVFVTLRK